MPQPIVRAAATLALLAALLAACAPTPTASSAPSAVPTVAATAAVVATAGPTASPTVGPSLGRDASWRADLDRIVPGMAAIHPNLFHGTSRTDLEARVAALWARVPTATDDELMVGVLRIVALVSAAGCDGHTGAFVWGTGTYPVDSLPLRLWLFDDDLVVVDALPPYADLIGLRVDAIESHPTADVLAFIDPLVPRDNAQTVRLVTPRFVLIPQVLRGLGLADEGPISLVLSSQGSASRTVDVDPLPMATYNAWAGPYGLHLPVDPDVHYLARIDDALWWELLPDGETLYVQDNRVDHLPDSQLNQLKVALADPEVARVVLDIRHNYGGELSALDPVAALFRDRIVDQPDRLFVIIGRNTFSAGSLLVARLERDTQAVFVGETMGGCPTLYGNSSDLELPFSGIVISVAGDLAVGVDPADTRQTIEPDVEAVLTLEEWAAGRDPALEAIVGVAP